MEREATLHVVCAATTTAAFFHDHDRAVPTKTRTKTDESVDGARKFEPSVLQYDNWRESKIEGFAIDDDESSF